jgi:hypothetical protein
MCEGHLLKYPLLEIEMKNLILVGLYVITAVSFNAHAETRTAIYPYELECNISNLWLDNRGSRPEMVITKLSLDKTLVSLKLIQDYTYLRLSNNRKLFVQRTPLTDPRYVLVTTLALNNITYGTSSDSDVSFEVRKVEDNNSHNLLNFNFNFEPMIEMTDQVTKERWYQDKVGQVSIYTPEFQSQLAEKNHDWGLLKLKPRYLEYAGYKDFKGEFLGVVINYCKLLSYQ